MCVGVLFTSVLYRMFTLCCVATNVNGLICRNLYIRICYRVVVVMVIVVLVNIVTLCDVEKAFQVVFSFSYFPKWIFFQSTNIARARFPVDFNVIYICLFSVSYSLPLTLILSQFLCLSRSLHLYLFSALS